MTISFDYFRFDPVDETTFLTTLRKNHEIPLEDAAWLYNNWLSRFYHNRVIFYHAQLDRYTLLLERRFEKIFNNHEWNSDKDRKETWLGYISDSELDRIQTIYVNAHSALASHEGKIDTGIILKKIHVGMRYQIPRRELESIWFNRVINNSREEIASYRKMRYSDYLKTRHWHRVKSALMLVNRGICQEVSCHGAGDSWYHRDWESAIHAHHISYESKGNEQFEDVILLCDIHHERWHFNKDNNLPQIEFVHL